MQTQTLVHPSLSPLPHHSHNPTIPRALLLLPSVHHPAPASPTPHPLLDRDSRDHTSLTSPRQYSFLVTNPSRPTSLPRHPPTRTRPMSPSNPRPPPSAQIDPSSSSSPPQTRPTPLFPPPRSAPHHLIHFTSSETSYPPNMERYPIVNLADRYLRANDKYSLNQHPLLDQRRMSEPSMYGSAAGGHPSHAADLSNARFRQLHHQFSYVPPTPYPPHTSPPLSRSPIPRPPPHASWKDDNQLPSHHHDLDEPLSPLNPTFSGGDSSPPMGMSGVMFGSLHEDYGPSPPGTGTSTSSTAPATHQQPTTTPGPSSPSHTKQYSFVSLPGNGIRKRPRRRYDEIERLYQCSWQNCTKSYGTLNHLNAHITMQKHGPKRSPNEFKELRKQWRKAKKEEAEARALETVRHGPHQHQPVSQQHPSRHSTSDVDYQTHNIRPQFDYAPHPERSIQPIAPLDDLHDPHQRDPRRSQQRYGPFVSPHPQHSGIAYPHPQPQGTNTSNVPMNRLPANSTLLTPLPGYEPSSIGGAPNFSAYSSYDLYRSDNRSRTGQGSPGRHGDRGRSRSSHDWS